MFNSIKHYALFALISMVIIASPVIASATSVAAVNVQKIMRDAKAAKSVRTQLESKQKDFQAELKKIEDELQKEDQGLAKQRSILAPDAFERKVQEFRKKAAAAQKEAQKKRAMLDRAFAGALNDIQKQIGKIVEKLSKEKGYEVVVPTSQILYVDSTLDITDEVRTRLDKKLPTVKVNVK
jgi:Skp family chaperone for outer membrane proteins